MAIGDLVPWNWGRRVAPVRREERPFLALQREMNRIFDDFMSGEPFAAVERMGAFTPRVDVRDEERELIVTAELPGLEEKDVELSLTEDSLTIRGEKRAEREERDGGRGVYVERSYGAFERVIPMAQEIDEAKVEATFRNGVLTVTLPKLKEGRGASRKISIKKS